jgi:hypothetical protein
VKVVADNFGLKNRREAGKLLSMTSAYFSTFLIFFLTGLLAFVRPERSFNIVKRYFNVFLFTKQKIHFILLDN